MRKITLAVAAVVLCLSVMTGCSRSEDYSKYQRDKSSQKIEQKGKVTIEEVKPEKE